MLKKFSSIKTEEPEYFNTDPKSRRGTIPENKIINYEDTHLPRINSKPKLLGEDFSVLNESSDEDNDNHVSPYTDYKLRSDLLTTHLSNLKNMNSPKPGLISNNLIDKKVIFSRFCPQSVKNYNELIATKIKEIKSKAVRSNKHQHEMDKFQITQRILKQSINKINYPFQKKKMSSGLHVLENEGIRTKLLEIHNYPLIFPDRDQKSLSKSRNKRRKVILRLGTIDNPPQKEPNKINSQKNVKPKMNLNSLNNPYLSIGRKTSFDQASDKNIRGKTKVVKEPNYLYKFNDETIERNDNKGTSTNIFNNYIKENPKMMSTSFKINNNVQNHSLNGKVDKDNLVVLKTAKLNNILNNINKLHKVMNQ